MNTFQTVDSGKGLLKDNYDDGEQEDPAYIALKKRQQKMALKLKMQSATPKLDDASNVDN